MTSITQTRDGYLWLGTYGGLVRFDGVRFQTFTIEEYPKLRSNRILSLLEDSRGALWVGTQDAGLSVMREGRFDHIEGSRAAGEIWSIVERRPGEVWTAGANVGRFRDGSVGFQPVVLPTDAPTTCYCLHQDIRGRLWLGTDRGLFEWAGGRFAPVELPASAAMDGSTRVWTLASDHAGALWIVSSREVGRLVDGQYRAVSAAARNERAAAIVTRSGDFVFQGRGGRLRQLDAAEGWRESKRKLPSAFSGDVGVRALVQDGEGNYWVSGNAGGIARITTEPFARVGRRMGLPAGVRSLFDDGDGGLWVDAVGPAPLVVNCNAEKLTYLSLADAGVQAGARGAAPGVVWFNGADRSRGVVRVTTDGVESEAGVSRESSRFVRAHDGSQWITHHGVLYRLVESGAQGGPVVATVPSEADGRWVRPLSACRDGALWLLATDRFVRWSPDSPAEAPREVELPADLGTQAVRALHEDWSGDAWVSTYGMGLYRLRGGRIDRLGSDQGLPDVNLGGIVEDDNGRLWVNSNNGVLVIPLDEMEAAIDGVKPQISCRVLSTGEGSGATAVRTEDGRMWFPTADDLVVADAETYEQSTTPPSVRIETVTVDHPLEQAQRHSVTIPPGRDDMQICYTAFAFANPEQLRFRYRLVGYDDRWVEAGVRRTAYYTQTPPGSYRFEVEAMNQDGVWSSAPATVDITVEPFFYQTASFKVLCALGLAGVALGVHRVRVQTFKRHAEELRVEIDEREQAEEDRRRLEATLAESTKFEAVGRLAGGVAHDFNNVLTAVMGRSELLKMDLNRSPDDRAERRLVHVDEIIRSSERAERLTRQLLAFSRQQVLNPTLVNVEDAVRKLEPLLRDLLPANIRLEVDVQRGTPPVFIDAGQLDQVVMNLVLNARDAMPGGGLVSLGAERLPATPGSEVGDRVAITVSDTGVGIGEDAIQHLFEPFYTTKALDKGSGLGLASVHGIVTQSGGEVLVDSQPNQGATFRVLLPPAGSEGATVSE